MYGIAALGSWDEEKPLPDVTAIKQMNAAFSEAGVNLYYFAELDHDWDLRGSDWWLRTRVMSRDEVKLFISEAEKAKPRKTGWQATHTREMSIPAFDGAAKPPAFWPSPESSSICILYAQLNGKTQYVVFLDSEHHLMAQGRDFYFPLD
jgi:hypothetical protein